MKSILYLICFIFAVCSADGQYYGRGERGFMLGINAGYTYPLGDFGKVAKNGLGANISAKYLVNEVIGIGFESGYHTFRQGGDLAIQDANRQHTTKYKLIPILLEGTFYIPTWDRSLLPYFGIHFGAYLTNINIEQTVAYSPEDNAKENLWRFSPGVGIDAGILIELTQYVKMDIKIKGDYIPKIKADYNRDELGNQGNIGFDKMLNIGASIGLLYTFR